MHLVHFGGGISGHIKLAGGRFFDWVAAGKRVYTDLSWAIGFAPRWLVDEIAAARASATTGCCSPATSPGATTPGEYARLRAVAGGRELADLIFRGTFDQLYG